MYGDLQLVGLYKKNIPYSQNLIVCPMATLCSELKDTFKVGGQNCHQEKEGAFTGEISPLSLKEVGCEYVLLGHSERRKYFGETNELVIKKAVTAKECGLTPIICVGSNSEDIVQIKQDLIQQLPQDSSFIIAYEPTWAIGTNKIPSLDHIDQIMQWLANQGFSQKVYGGSVNSENAQDIHQLCQGLLIGRASLDIHSVLTIGKSLEIWN